VHGKFALSSDSIYSRTTGGNTIPDGQSGHNSLEDTDESPSVGGMATIVPTKVPRYPRPTPRLVQLHRARSTERGEWKGWMENQMASLDRRHSGAITSHHREHAQIDVDDTAVGSGCERPTNSTGFATGLGRHGSQRTIRTKDGNVTPVPLQRKSSIMSESFPLLDLKELLHDTTPTPTASDPKRASMVRLNDKNRNAGGGDIQRRTSGHLRKKRSQLVFNYRSKEENSQPVSDLGHLRRPINEDRNAASFASLEELTPTPKQKPKSQMSLSNWAQFEKPITIDLDGNLARLSRPFDMDIPNGNRPFDSKYLGTDQSYGIGGKAAG
jgi:hypothetical protein